MKTILALLLAVALCGCASTNQSNASTFLAKVAAMNITAADVSQTTVGPFYSHSESVAGLTYTPTGFSVQNLKASFSIPLPVMQIPLLQWNLSASAISGTNPAQLAAVAGLSAK